MLTILVEFYNSIQQTKYQDCRTCQMGGKTDLLVFKKNFLVLIRRCGLREDFVSLSYACLGRGLKGLKVTSGI